MTGIDLIKVDNSWKDSSIKQGLPSCSYNFQYHATSGQNLAEGRRYKVVWIDGLVTVFQKTS